MDQNDTPNAEQLQRYADAEQYFVSALSALVDVDPEKYTEVIGNIVESFMIDFEDTVFFIHYLLTSAAAIFSQKCAIAGQDPHVVLEERSMFAMTIEQNPELFNG